MQFFILKAGNTFKMSNSRVKGFIFGEDGGDILVTTDDLSQISTANRIRDALALQQQRFRSSR